MLEPPFLILFFYLLPLLGDLGKVDKKGFVYIVDRKKDIIIRGGENISCAEVEGAFYEHPAVMECCVFGVPDPRLGEKVAAMVVLKTGKILKKAVREAVIAGLSNAQNKMTDARSKL